MGMDGVEIVMEVEDAFDIRIENSEAEIISTPRQLIELVLCKVTVATTTTCLTQRAFNFLRKSLLRRGEWRRRDIAPTTSLATLIPKHQRRALMEQVTMELGIKKPPAFARPTWLKAILFAASVLSGFLAAVMVLPSATLSFLCFAGVASVVAWICAKLTMRLRTEFPTDMQTVGHLARWVMTRKADLANAASSGWTRDQIAARLRQIVIDILGCKPDFGEDARFVEDLGLS